MKRLITLILLFVLVAGCTVEPAIVPTASPAPTMTASPVPPTVSTTPTPIPPTNTPTPTITYTPTPTPQPLLLRRKCGRDYMVDPDMPLQIFYGGWGVRGKDLADQWSTSLVIDLTIDGETVEGANHPRIFYRTTVPPILIIYIGSIIWSQSRACHLAITTSL